MEHKSTTVYEALFNPCTWESGYATLSLHWTKEGAEKAIAFSKMEEMKKWQKLYPTKEDEPFAFGDDLDWSIRKTKILP